MNKPENIKKIYPLKLKPIYKEAIWAGTRLKRDYGADVSTERLAEEWLLTVRGDGMSVIENGVYKDMTLGEYLSAAESEFPLLVKFIDAGDKLSVQVHPDKTELWYIVEANDNSQIVYGLNKYYSKTEIGEALDKHQIEHMLKYINVKAGEFYYIPSGLVHAIGGGILIAEIQQNSNTTYRLYDYNRKQADGSFRELHIDKALDTIKHFENISESDHCKYFIVDKYVISGRFDFEGSKTFRHIICLDGNCFINGTEPLNKGDSYFLPSGIKEFYINSITNVTVLVSSNNSDKK